MTRMLLFMFLFFKRSVYLFCFLAVVGLFVAQGLPRVVASRPLLIAVRGLLIVVHGL